MAEALDELRSGLRSLRQQPPAAKEAPTSADDDPRSELRSGLASLRGSPAPQRRRREAPEVRFPAQAPMPEGGFIEHATQPLVEIGPDIVKAFGRHYEGGVTDASELFKGLFGGKGLGHAALSALGLFGDVLAYPFSPLEGAIEALATGPAERSLVQAGVPAQGFGRFGAELGSQSAQLLMDPIAPFAATKEGAILAGVKPFTGPTTTPTGIAAQGVRRGAGEEVSQMFKKGAPLYAGPALRGVPTPSSAFAEGFPNAAARIGKTADQIKATLSPTSRGPEAKLQEQLIRRVYTGPLARSEAQARRVLESFRGEISKADPAARFAFRQAAEGDPAAPQLPEPLQELANSWRDLQQTWEKRLMKSGILKGAVDNYYPHLYEFLDLDGTTALDEAKVNSIWQQVTNRPLRGSKTAAGLRNRTIPYLSDLLTETAADGKRFGFIRNAAGQPAAIVKLRFGNPIDEMLYRIQGMQRYYYGTELAQKMKETNLLRWVPGIGRGPTGTAKLDDNVFKKILPPVGKVSAAGEIISEHFRAYDPQLKHGLDRLRDFLGSKLREPIGPPIPERPGVTGYFDPSTGEIASRFGANQTTYMHEIGHAIDKAYGLTATLGAAPKAKVLTPLLPGSVEWKELQELGHLRAPYMPRPGTAQYQAMGKHLRDYIDYIEGIGGNNASELVANLFHAYWHAPELLQNTAPNAARMLDQFLVANPDLKVMVDAVKPSVRTAADLVPQTHRWEYVSQFYPGVRLLGSWWAPEPMANVFNNFVSKSSIFGREPGGVYDSIRRAGNALNMLQLGFSAFHFGMTSYDTVVSQLALAARMAADKEFGMAGRAALSAFTGPIQTARRGHELWNTWLDPKLNPELNKVAKALETAGGRITMDRMWSASGSGSFVRALKDGHFTKLLSGEGTLEESLAPLREELKRTVNPAFEATLTGIEKTQGKPWLGGALRVAGRTIETTMYPLMEYWVPTLKAGVFRDMAEYWLYKHPNATQSEMTAEMIKVMDSVDNRLGQVIYDNLFWAKTLKDISHLAVRAVGWNLGTLRELGGGVVDTAKAVRGLTDRTGRNVPEFTYRMAYTATLPVITAFMGAVLNKLYTGENPREWRDYFFPRNGRLDQHGKAARVSQPNYMKDVFSFSAHPVATLMAKMHPLLETGSELYNNRDFFGGIIYDPDSPNGIFSVLPYGLKQLEPFSLRGQQIQRQQKADWFPQLMSYFGFVPASQTITNPARSERFERIQRMRARRARRKEYQ